MKEMSQTLRKIRKKERIIEVAASMLENQDYNEIRIENISARFKMAKTMVFYYFDSKAALYLAVLEKLHLDTALDFREELKKFELQDYESLKKYIMSMTHKYIQDHYLLIKLLDCEERIYSEALPQQIMEASKKIDAAYDELLSDILQKSNFLTRNELFYIFEVQRHFLRGYYRQMMSHVKYFTSVNSYDHDFERKSLYEFRVLRMLRYFFDGIVANAKK